MRAILLVLLLWPAAAMSQVVRDDPVIGAALAQALGAQSEVLQSYLIANDADPARATEAIGIVYTAIVGAAGNFDIAVGLFRRVEQGFVLVGRIDGIYGVDPRDARFLPDRIMLATTTLRANDARCCPSGTTVWTVPRATLTASGAAQ